LIADHAGGGDQGIADGDDDIVDVVIDAPGFIEIGGRHRIAVGIDARLIGNVFIRRMGGDGGAIAGIHRDEPRAYGAARHGGGEENGQEYTHHRESMKAEV